MSRNDEEWLKHQIQEIPYEKRRTRYDELDCLVQKMKPNTRVRLHTNYECDTFRKYAKKHNKKCKTEIGNGAWWGYILDDSVEITRKIK